MITPLLALKLKQLRLKHNYTQKYLSHILNMSRGGYAQYETDARTPSIEMLLKLSILYNVGIDTFINTETIQISFPTAPKNAENRLQEETNFDCPQLDARQIHSLGKYLLQATPSLNVDTLSQEDINFLGIYKNLPEETQEDLKMFCHAKYKKINKIQKEIPPEE